jgi:hypothetical protein
MEQELVSSILGLKVKKNAGGSFKKIYKIAIGYIDFDSNFWALTINEMVFDHNLIISLLFSKFKSPTHLRYTTIILTTTLHTKFYLNCRVAIHEQPGLLHCLEVSIGKDNTALINIAEIDTFAMYINDETQLNNCIGMGNIQCLHINKITGCPNNCINIIEAKFPALVCLYIAKPTQLNDKDYNFIILLDYRCFIDNSNIYSYIVADRCRWEYMCFTYIRILKAVRRDLAAPLIKNARK